MNFASFLSTPFELYALNTILLFTLFLSNFIFQLFWVFFDKVSESNPMLHFGSFLSGQNQN